MRELNNAKKNWKMPQVLVLTKSRMDETVLLHCWVSPGGHTAETQTFMSCMMADICIYCMEPSHT